MRKSAIALVTAFLLSVPLFSSEIGVSAFVDGCRAYSQGDWTSAIFSLKQASFYGENNNPETYYMLINAEVYAGQFNNALDDCDWYLGNFPNSMYEAYVMYLKGRCYYLLGEYDKAVIILSDFCHQYTDHDMYASAIFWIAESFYACYQYNDALGLYQRIVTEFAGDSKAPPSQYRIETINQREREEKLLYLLKQTGEEYLVAREEYEKQLKIYSPESAATTRQKLYEAQEQNRILEEKYHEIEKEIAELKGAGYKPLAVEKPVEQPKEEVKKDNNGLDIDSVVTSDTKTAHTDEEIELLRRLKAKAAETRLLMDSKREN